MARRIEWAMWANEQAIMSCFVLAFGSLIGISSLLLEKPHTRWHLSLYGLIFAILVFILEYPRGKRAKGHTRKRLYQEYATKVVSSIGVFGTSYFLRFFMYILFCVPTLFSLASCTGGLCLIMAAITYLKAAIEDEKWFPCGNEVVKRKSLSLPRPPSIAPPRFPNFTHKDALDCVVYSAVAFEDCLDDREEVNPMNKRYLHFDESHLITVRNFSTNCETLRTKDCIIKDYSKPGTLESMLIIGLFVH